MYSSIPALDTAPFNSMDNSVYLSPSLPPSLREQIAEAVRTGWNMTEADPDDLADEPDLIQVSSNTAAIVVPAYVQQPLQQLNERERMVQSLANEWAGKPHTEILHSLGAHLGPLVLAVLHSQAPTLKQAFMERERAIRTANADFGKALQAAGKQPQQHSVSDFVHVRYTQLELLLHGEEPSVSKVLSAAYPDDPTKAKSIRGSTRVNRWKQADNFDAVRNHPIEVAMQTMYSTRCLDQRHSARTFGQSLALITTLFKSCDRITKQGAEIDQLKREVQLFKQQMQSMKNREALADAGCTTSREKVLALYDQGKRQTEIAKLLNMQLDAVKYHIKAIRKSRTG